MAEKENIEVKGPVRELRKGFTINSMKLLKLDFKAEMAKSGISMPKGLGVEMGWDFMVALANSLIKSGPKFDGNSQMSEFIEVMKLMGDSGFLVKK